MRNVYFSSGNIITSLGFSTDENAAAMLSGRVGIRIYNDPGLYPGPVPVSRVDDERLNREFEIIRTNNSRLGLSDDQFSRLEKMLFCSITSALENSPADPSDPRTLFIISTTKGNIDLLACRPGDVKGRLHLWELAGFIAQLFNCSQQPFVISSACISGSVALITAARMIASGKYDHAIVTGGDIVSEFVVSGFMSFQALSPDPCKPFDASRTGLSIGEGCGTVIMSVNPEVADGQAPVRYLGGAVSNDANHISGPSRDGEGLYLSIAAAMREAGVSAGDIDFISAHGTATPYNDEMESLALAWAGLDNVPVNSFKGYIGHTLGAAGIIETILSLYSMQNNVLIQSAGYTGNGVSKPLHIVTENTTQTIRNVLKTASGFGGCNAALVVGR